jgi:hypothetical protein
MLSGPLCGHEGSTFHDRKGTPLNHLVESYDGLPGHHLLTDSGMRRVRAGLDRVGRVLESVAIERVHLPDILGPQALAEARQWLSPAADLNAVTTAFSGRPCGALPLAGLCFPALALLRGRQWSHRDLPVGCYTVGPASPPMATDRAEDVSCVNGALLTETESAADTVLDEAFGTLFPDLEPSAGPWGLDAPARIWSRAGEVFAVAQGLDRSAQAPDQRIRYATRNCAHRAAAVTFLYVSEQALLHLGAT